MNKKIQKIISKEMSKYEQDLFRVVIEGLKPNEIQDLITWWHKPCKCVMCKEYGHHLLDRVDDFYKK